MPAEARSRRGWTLAGYARLVLIVALLLALVAALGRLGSRDDPWSPASVFGRVLLILVPISLVIRIASRELERVGAWAWRWAERQTAIPPILATAAVASFKAALLGAALILLAVGGLAWIRFILTNFGWLIAVWSR